MSAADVPSEVRVRFAPSPTGFLHIGGVRTALFNWLYARHTGGKFLLRIEDTDLERSEDSYTQDILASMKWLGLNWDEDPIYQSQRLDIYRAKTLQLLEKGFAYRCYCTEAEVEQMRELATKEGKKPQYNRHCRDLPECNGPEKTPSGKPYVIRAKLPLTGAVEFLDLIRGTIRFENTELDDFVIIRTSGAPTYNLSVVIDDVYSKMTHIIRGDDHVNNTPKQVHLYNFFNYPVPKFAHIPMILGPDKKKLSKRHGAVSANLYRQEGYLPEALMNFLVRLGWSHGDQEEFSIAEMIEYFDFDHVQKSSAVFNVEKLNWVNGVHMRKAPPERLLKIVVEDYHDQFNPQAAERAQTEIGVKLVALIQQKVKLLKEIAEQLVPLCTPGAVEIDASGLKWNKDPALKTATKAAVLEACGGLSKKVSDHGKNQRSGKESAWGTSPSLSDIGMDHTAVDAFLRVIGEKHGVKLGDLAQPMRLAVTGRMVSAGLFDLMAVLPWDVVEARLRKVELL
jgi:glutamyl-tRNA synthetase